ncbi:MAG: hypothetical protein OXH93_02660, partial [Caldilineaceae bacterium]|nr:hypothetical protein [Caldilineaceae bacterium]
MSAFVMEPKITADKISVPVEDLDAAKAAAVYREHGCLVVRGLMKPYIEEMAADIGATVRQSIEMLD